MFRVSSFFKRQCRIKIKAKEGKLICLEKLLPRIGNEVRRIAIIIQLDGKQTVGVPFLIRSEENDLTSRQPLTGYLTKRSYATLEKWITFVLEEATIYSLLKTIMVRELISLGGERLRDFSMWPVSQQICYIVQWNEQNGSVMLQLFRDATAPNVMSVVLAMRALNTRAFMSLFLNDFIPTKKA